MYSWKVKVGALFLALVAFYFTQRYGSNFVGFIPNKNPPKFFADPFEHAIYLHSLTPMTDTHNDLPLVIRSLSGGNFLSVNLSENLSPRTHTDIPRLRKGVVGAQIWSVYVPCNTPFPVQQTIEQIDIVYQMAQYYPRDFALATTTSDIMTAFRAGRIASLIGMEGGHSINSSLGTLRMFRQLGASYMTLTHNCNTPWAQAANQPNGSVIGLTPFGKQVVLEMNKIGMMVDLSHVAPQTMHDALDTSLAPVIFSHSNAKALCDVPRNVPDDVLDRLPANGGVVMVVFYPGFVCPPDQQANCSLSDVADHIDYIKNRIGVDHIGYGADYDGVSELVRGLEDVSTYPYLTAELIRRGYTDEEVLRITSINILRVISAVSDVSQKLTAQAKA